MIFHAWEWNTEYERDFNGKRIGYVMYERNKTKKGEIFKKVWIEVDNSENQLYQVIGGELIFEGIPGNFWINNKGELNFKEWNGDIYSYFQMTGETMENFKIRVKEMASTVKIKNSTKKAITLKTGQKLRIEKREVKEEELPESLKRILKKEKEKEFKEKYGEPITEEEAFLS